ncbi:MAG: AraC family transcriptional regulator, partial [Lachnospiraceae bacterium]|nr:AraC family transcriptional regulator [Lachnospiraceae bacterium]
GRQAGLRIQVVIAGACNAKQSTFIYGDVCVSRHVRLEEKQMRETICRDCVSDSDAKVLFKEKSCTVYRRKNETGTLTITEHHVFPGIWLVSKDAHIQKYTYPAAYPSGLLEITHCREGRFEYDAGNQFFYLGKGDLSINRSRGGEAAVFCPTRHYHGISVIIDPDLAPRCLSCILDDVNVRPSALLNKFCQGNGHFIIRSTPQLEHIFSELYSVPKDIRKGYFKVKVLELLLFLSGLDPSLSQTKQRACSKAQAALAKEICAYIDSHMNVRLTTEQLAAQFFVSPAQLKKCFYDVYGESVYAYIRSYKMQAAARFLKTTDCSVTEIAGLFGYSNSSKFAGAFREVMGVSPTEHRNTPT